VRSILRVDDREEVDEEGAEVVRRLIMLITTTKHTRRKKGNEKKSMKTSTKFKEKQTNTEMNGWGCIDKQSKRMRRQKACDMG
jgi:hypothetical protein